MTPAQFWELTPRQYVWLLRHAEMDYRALAMPQIVGACMVAGAWGAEYKADEIMDQLYGAITKPKGKEKKSFAPADNITKDNIQYKLLRGLMDMAIAKKKPIPNLREGDTLISVSDVLLKLLRKILKESDEPEPKVLYRVSWLPVRDEIKRLENLGA